MAEVPNQRVIDKYREHLSVRTHDAIVMQLAIEMLEVKVAELTEENRRLKEGNNE